MDQFGVFGRRLAVGVLVAVGLAGPAGGQCNVLVADSFHLGPRPHGGRGDVRDVFVHDGLNGFWAQVGAPGGTRWLTGDGSQTQGWAFAASSIDPAEPAEDEFGSNGTVVGEGHAAALLPVAIPPGAVVTISADVAPVFTLSDGVCIGFTTSAAPMTSNFESVGRLWLRFDGLGRYSVRANGLSSEPASGVGDFGLLGSGWTHLEMTFDSAAGVVSGRVGGVPFGPAAVPAGGVITHAGMEADAPIGTFQVLNNFSVRAGPAPAFITGPRDVQVCAGGEAVFSAEMPGPGPWAIVWRRDGWPLADGPGVSGSGGPVLTLSGVQEGAAIDCVAGGFCGLVESRVARLEVMSCCRADLNGDGLVDFSDYLEFLNLYDAADVRADLTGDGLVDFGDYLEFLNLYDAGC